METVKYWKAFSFSVLLVVLPLALFSSQGTNHSTSLRGGRGGVGITSQQKLVDIIQLASLEGVVQPSPWKQYTDATTGNVFWYNEITTVSQWETPEEIATPVTTTFEESPAAAQTSALANVNSQKAANSAVESATGETFGRQSESSMQVHPSTQDGLSHEARVAAGDSKPVSHADREERGESVVVSHADRVDAEADIHLATHAERSEGSVVEHEVDAMPPLPVVEDGSGEPTSGIVQQQSTAPEQSTVRGDGMPPPLPVEAASDMAPAEIAFQADREERGEPIVVAHADRVDAEAAVHSVTHTEQSEGSVELEMHALPPLPAEEGGSGEPATAGIVQQRTAPEQSTAGGAVPSVSHEQAHEDHESAKAELAQLEGMMGALEGLLSLLSAPGSTPPLSTLPSTSSATKKIDATPQQDSTNKDEKTAEKQSNNDEIMESSSADNQSYKYTKNLNPSHPQVSEVKGHPVGGAFIP
mmetsp:Transcript_37157/g.61195  ORF Transcript_37157/g.61195 Transcript_37157/m.61195 type:complete len:472 (-) Transcript_37157:399-1814(-)